MKNSASAAAVFYLLNPNYSILNHCYFLIALCHCCYDGGAALMASYIFLHCYIYLNLLNYILLQLFHIKLRSSSKSYYVL